MGATMNIELAKIFKHKAINEWGLVLVFAVPMCIFNYLAMTDTNIDSPEGLSHMIGYSVRWAVPFIYLVVAASSVKILFPGVFSAWWMRNRKYIGLVFAVGMAWQAAFIFMLSTFHRDYYFSDVYYFRDEVEGSVGYIFLVAMVITSFQFARKRVNHAQWKLIQKGGIYFLWAYPFSVYWWNLFYYPYVDGYSNPELHDYLFYWAGFLAFAMRIFAWGKLRNKALSKSDVNGSPSTLALVLGAGLIFVGLIGAATGKYWFDGVSSLVSSPAWSAEMALWLPFWPLEPFMPLILMGAGVYLATKGRALRGVGVVTR
jgi:DMSO/TMAO reductase YedYZ heme-binding membrane subunit